MEKLIETILSAIVTVEEQESVRRAVAELRDTLYRKFPDEFDGVIRTKFRADIATSLAGFFHTPSYMRNPNRIGVELSQLERAIAAMRVLRLEVAIDPTPALVYRIAVWVRAQIGPDIALEMERNISIGAGARMMFAGHYRDHTLAEMLREVFEKKRDVILAELASPRAEPGDRGRHTP